MCNVYSWVRHYQPSVTKLVKNCWPDSSVTEIRDELRGYDVCYRALT